MTCLKRRASPLVLACLLLGLAAAPAAAHAIIIAAKPAVDATVAGPDVPIELRFNSRIDRARSRLTLVGPDRGAKTLALGADTAPDLLTARASGLVPGAYRLRWQVLSIDGHITRGDIPFSVGH
jgi:methionine-rich copper-binding protein CopC